MQITINGQSYNIPVSLMDVTLADRIRYEQQYGKPLKERLKAILDIQDEFEKDLQIMEYQFELANKTLSFFGKIPLDIIEQTAIEEVLIVYYQYLKAISEEVDYSEETYVMESSFTWQDATWELQPPELSDQSKMTFAEFLDAKQLVKNLWELSQDNWEALLMLCCVYLRKEGEEYSDNLINENGERYRLMQSLPLQYALQVGFFFTASMSLYMKTYHYSSQVRAQAFQN